MSRSYRKTPIFGITTAASDKRFKVREHRRERREAKARVRNGEPPRNPKRYGDPWSSEKDGKHYWANARPSDFRK